MIIMCVCVYICVITKPNTKSFAQYQVETPKWAASANSQEAVDQGQLAATTLKCTTFKRTKRVRNSSWNQVFRWFCRRVSASDLQEMATIQDFF